jgi:hypothetical protein
MSCVCSKAKEVKTMKRIFWAIASLGMLTALISMVPDIRRYIRISSM